MPVGKTFAFTFPMPAQIVGSWGPPPFDEEPPAAEEVVITVRILVAPGDEEAARDRAMDMARDHWKQELAHRRIAVH